MNQVNNTSSMGARLQLISAMVTFGTIGIFVRHIDLPSSAIALVRGVVGTLFLLAVVYGRGKALDLAAIKRNLGLLCLSGLCIGFNWILLFEAYHHTTVATATLSYYLCPIFVILASPFVLKEQLTLAKMGCVLLAICGMVLISGVLQGGSQGVTLFGILLGAGAASLYATVIMLNKFLRDISAYEMTIMQLGAAALTLLPYTLLTENVASWQPDTTSLILLAVVGVFHTGITYAMYFNSLQGLPAQTAAIFSYIDPVVAILLSALLLSEPMDGFTMLGAAMVLGSTMLLEFVCKK